MKAWQIAAMKDFARDAGNHFYTEKNAVWFCDLGDGIYHFTINSNRGIERDTEAAEFVAYWLNKAGNLEQP
jgi:hypothetical protein